MSSSEEKPIEQQILQFILHREFLRWCKTHIVRGHVRGFVQDGI